jgi:translation initiation factor IF-2
LAKENKYLISRPPIVVVLGHVDHGKTTILDYIRKTKVAEKESGGITQHIGAYEIEKDDKKITFIDTPGHEAFSAMRGRGAKVADIAILVVAAEEGVKPQTKEAIAHIKKAGIPMIVAINKIDKSEANPEKVKRELAENEVLVEKLGGKIPSVEVSAKTGQGTEDLLELIILVAEMEKLEGDISKPAEGLVIESYLDALRGPTATLLLRDGVLNASDIIGTASAIGKVKSLETFRGASIKKAFPSQPVVVLGFEKAPQVGEKFKVFSDISDAQKYLEKKEKKAGGGEVLAIGPDQKVLNLILKADVSGSLEAIESVIDGLPQEKVFLRILKKEVGEINESDVRLASSAKARILGFRVKISPIAAEVREKLKVGILAFDVIYDLVQALRTLMEKLVEPEIIKTITGKIKILAIFKRETNRQVIGGKVTEGEIKLGAKIEAFRGEEKVGEGKLVNLQKNKKDAEKALKGEECGLLYQGEGNVEEGDLLVVFQEEKRKGEL